MYFHRLARIININKTGTSNMAEEHHVHFDESTDGLKNNDIVIKKKSENKIEIQLGFLQVNHMYEDSLVCSRTIFPANCDLKDLVQNDDPVPNINCRIISIVARDGENVEMIFKFSAVKEKLVRERLNLIDKNININLEVIARVLGKGKGTPMLRTGIKCIEVLKDLDTETEASDWQGF